jgi:hypothetical protein
MWAAQAIRLYKSSKMFYMVTFFSIPLTLENLPPLRLVFTPGNRKTLAGARS